VIARGPGSPDRRLRGRKDATYRHPATDVEQAAADFEFYAEHPEWPSDVAPLSNRYSEYAAWRRAQRG
jgi:hypothetical protein